MDLDKPLELRTAGEYATPGVDQATAILPEVFGNCLSSEATSDAGAVENPEIATPTVLIDRLRLVYCANARRTDPAHPMVFHNGKPLQSLNTYSWNPADNYEGRGIIATLTFNTAPTGVISIRHGGAVDAGGQPITNPIYMLYTLLTERAGWTLNDFDRAMCQRSAADMTALGYPAYGCFQERKTIREWLLELMPQYHTDFTENGQGQLSMILDRSLTTFPVLPDYHVPAYEIEDFGRPATAILPEAHHEDIVNQITIHGRYNWATQEPAAAYTWNYLQSQSVYGQALPAEFTFRHMYTMAHAAQWLNSHAMRHGFEPKTVRFTMRSLRGLALISPRFITVEWPLLGWVRHLLKVLEVTARWEARTTGLTCVDCGRELTDVVTSPIASPTMRRQQLSRIYSWIPGTIGDHGELGDSPQNTRNKAANGDCERGDNGQWNLYSSNAAKQWVFVQDDTESYQGQYSLRHQPGAGTGVAYTLRQRIDPGEWVVASAWFRQHVGGTNGTTCSVIYFSDVNDSFTGATFAGNAVVPTNTYLESVAYGQAPPGTYYFRPGIAFISYPTAGQWRADYLFADAGTQQEVLAARQGPVGSRNFVINGDFELGPVMWQTATTWLITNNPAVVAHSGIWYAAHAVTASGLEERLSSLTEIAVTPGQTFTFQAYVQTLNNPIGTGRLGVTWLDGQGNLLAENATAAGAGPVFVWTLSSVVMAVPANAVTAHVWIGITGHTGPVNSFWLIDTTFVFS